MTTRRFVAFALVGAFAGCKCKGKKTEDTATTTQAGAGSGSQTGEGPPKRPAITPAELAPIIHELGMEHVVPTAVVISLATPVTDQVGSTSSESVFKITPEAP